MSGQLANADRVIARLAERAHGLVTRVQLLATGLTRNQIDERVATGGLIPVYRGVYRVGHAAPNDEAHYLAAVLACRKDALLGGMAAAHLRSLVRGGARPPEVITAKVRRIAGIVTRCRPWLVEQEASSCRGVPTLSPAAVLVEIAAVLGEEELGRACHEAGVRYGTSPRDVERVLLHCPNAKGANKLKRILTGEAKISLSRIESMFVRRLREADLPPPETNRPAGGRRVDCRWPAHHLTVELDGYRFHSSRHAWEQDRQREREARLRGDEFRRFTWRDVMEDPRYMMRELTRLLVKPA
jgi:hypothetical protein